MSPKPTIFDPELGPLTDDLLTPEYRVYQRSAGHRFSSDDVATAFAGFRARPDATRILDLGCGLGSVLLLLAWRLREATLVGVEAQAMSFELLRRNVARNDLSARVTLHHGDLRAQTLADTVGDGFDLVTGTPPYFPEDAARPSKDEQRTRARIETRGGVEAYIEAGLPLLTPRGRLVLCGDARADERVRTTTARLGATLVGAIDVVPREGRAPLFSIWELSGEAATSPAGAARPSMPERTTMTLRDATGAQTRDADALRTFCGFSSMFA
jgi:tRNA1(Val) A37 N6-methylase TrmN6